MQRLRQGDDVIVTTGKDKGRRGSLTRVREDGRVIIENVNIGKKHQRPNPNAGVPGGIIEKESAIDPSNVMLFNPATNKGDRVGFKVLADGRKVRYFKSNGEVVDS
jgi:large subunit ribosomal protein L24